MTGRPATAKSPDERRMSAATRWTLTAVAGVAVVGLLWALFGRASSSAGLVPYTVGQPGKGAVAPAFTLPASTGGRVDLSKFRGRSVLLYFQEGITCQPCWDQLVALEKATPDLRAAGVDQVVSITTDPVDVVTQKAHDEGIVSPVLSDTTLAVSGAYHANSYGMMGASRDGHSFILVDPDGVIRWRADYGGPPRYTMDVAVPTLLRQLRAGEAPR